MSYFKWVMGCSRTWLHGKKLLREGLGSLFVPWYQNILTGSAKVFIHTDKCFGKRKNHHDEILCVQRINVCFFKFKLQLLQGYGHPLIITPQLSVWWNPKIVYLHKRFKKQEKEYLSRKRAENGSLQFLSILVVTTTMLEP